jgi:hypothetical protein
MQVKSKDRSRQKGAVVIEFALCSLVWMPLLLGAIVFGINLVRAVQVSSLARDTGHMYAYGIDLSQQSSIIQNLGSGVGINSTTGNGAILLSTITVVTPDDCAALPSSISCANLDHPVWMKMLILGNRADVRTTLGTPNFSGVQAGQEKIFQPAQYVSDAKLLASDSLLSLFAKDDTGHYVPGQCAYVSEVNLISQAINWTDFSGTGSYARTIF